MNQAKIGSFLKKLRREKNLTQENLAERLDVSSRAISRWETGSNMPDISMLVEIADFYGVSIPEIINGERRSEDMNQEARDTAVKMAEYSKHEARVERQKAVSYLMMVFGVFTITSALAVFPHYSSWGGIYSVFGSIVLVGGVYLLTKPILAKRGLRVLTIVGCAALLLGLFTLSDYLAVTQFRQVPRFSYEKVYSSDKPDEIIHKTLFFTVVQKNPGTAHERVEIVRR